MRSFEGKIALFRVDLHSDKVVSGFNAEKRLNT